MLESLGKQFGIRIAVELFLYLLFHKSQLIIESQQLTGSPFGKLPIYYSKQLVDWLAYGVLFLDCQRQANQLAQETSRLVTF